MKSKNRTQTNCQRKPLSVNLRSNLQQVKCQFSNLLDKLMSTNQSILTLFSKSTKDSWIELLRWKTSSIDLQSRLERF